MYQSKKLLEKVKKISLVILDELGPSNSILTETISLVFQLYTTMFYGNIIIWFFIEIKPFMQTYNQLNIVNNTNTKILI